MDIPEAMSEALFQLEARLTFADTHRFKLRPWQMDLFTTGVGEMHFASGRWCGTDA